MSSRTRRAALSLLLATVGTATLLAPAAAGGSVTRFVDDDGTAGAGGCGGALSVPSSIQAAVDVSGPGDTIKVCAGTYPETVDVDVAGLTIRGVTRWSAKLNPTGSTIGAIIRVNADDVRLQWLKVLGRTTGSCQFLPAGILVNGVDGARIISNNVLASPKGDGRSGPCGLQTGIHVATGGSAVVRYNIVRDWRLQGIWLQAADAGTAVKDNSVRYWHPSVCGLTACTSGTGPAIALLPIGIHVHATSAVVTNNAVTGVPDGQVSQEIPTGIRVNSSTDVTVRGNLIRRVGATGIELTNVTASRVVRNAITGGAGNGLIAQGVSTGDTIRLNEVHGLGGNGIRLLAGATGNTLTGNDATGNGGTDCMDDPDASTWTDNLGDDASPADICAAPI